MTLIEMGHHNTLALRDGAVHAHEFSIFTNGVYLEQS